MRRGWWIAMLVGLAVTALPAAAQAAFPGQPGKIVFEGPGEKLWTQYQHGGELTQLTADVGFDPAWSADGKRVAFVRAVQPDGVEIFVIDEDGSGEARVTPTGLTSSPYDGWRGPAWSPDGTKLAFWNIQSENCSLGGRCIFTINVDGTGFQELRAGSDPAWSPDGSKIAFVHNGHIWTMDPDGNDATQVTTHDLPDDVDFSWPNWSPDGERIAFTNCDPACNPGCCGYTAEIHVVNADGTGHRRIAQGLEQPVWSPDGFTLLAQPPFGGRFRTVDPVTGTIAMTEVTGKVPDWQPVTGTTGHVRPKGASPTDVSLVPAYEYCLDPNRWHGPPLAFESCSPPTQKPGELTVGTPDANGQPAKSRSNVRINPLRGLPSTPADEADVRLRATINDVRLRSDLSDYAGDLELLLTVQITDKDNGGDAATSQQLTHAHPLPCAPTGDTTVGSTCQVDTTIEAIAPGAVKELQRAVWELGAIQVNDGAGNLFLTQGVFVP